MDIYDQMRKGFQEAKSYMSIADSMAGDIAGMLVGRLRKVPSWRLKLLKKELQQFNAHTGEWKS